MNENKLSKNKWEEILLFYANEISFEGSEPVYKFTKAIGTSPNGLPITVEDKDAENKFKSVVYQTVKKTNGNYDRDASMFCWLLKQKIITQQYYDNLIEIRNLRNEMVHRLDKYLDSVFPSNLNEKIK